MKKTLNDILNDFNTSNLSKVADGEMPDPNMLAGMQAQPMPAQPMQAQPMQAQPIQAQPVPIGSPAEAQAMAEQEAMAQAQAATNAANAEIAAQKAKEDAVTNAAQALVSAEQEKQMAMQTLNQVAADAINTENAAIAKEAADFGTIAGNAMADSFYSRMYMQDTLNNMYSNSYDAVSNMLDKQASGEYEVSMYAENAYAETENLLNNYELTKHASAVYDEVNAYLDSLDTATLASNAYEAVNNIY